MSEAVLKIVYEDTGSEAELSELGYENLVDVRCEAEKIIMKIGMVLQQLEEEHND